MGKLSEQYFDKSIKQIQASDIEKIIKEGKTEDYSLEYTEIPKSVNYDELAKEISAFLNTNGGLVIFGVRERKNKFPDSITWGNISKETLVRALRGKIEPWPSEMMFQQIINPNNENELIFVIEVPKSNEPPHMGSGTYYIRNVWESRPMGHYEVKNMFQQSYLYKDKIIENVIGPLFNDASVICKNIDYDYSCNLDVINKINISYRYLLYLTNDEEFYSFIDDFYSKIKEFNDLVSRYKGIINIIIKNAVKLKISGLDKDLIERQGDILQYKREENSEKLVSTPPQLSL